MLLYYPVYLFGAPSHYILPKDHYIPKSGSALYDIVYELLFTINTLSFRMISN